MNKHQTALLSLPTRGYERARAGSSRRDYTQDGFIKGDIFCPQAKSAVCFGRRLSYGVQFSSLSQRQPAPPAPLSRSVLTTQVSTLTTGGLLSAEEPFAVPACTLVRIVVQGEGVSYVNARARDPKAGEARCKDGRERGEGKAKGDFARGWRKSRCGVAPVVGGVGRACRGFSMIVGGYGCTTSCVSLPL